MIHNVHPTHIQRLNQAHGSLSQAANHRHMSHPSQAHQQGPPPPPPSHMNANAQMTINATTYHVDERPRVSSDEHYDARIRPNGPPKTILTRDHIKMVHVSNQQQMQQAQVTIQPNQTQQQQQQQQQSHIMHKSQNYHQNR